MNNITFSKHTKLIVLIWLTICEKQINSHELSCTIKTYSPPPFNNETRIIDSKPIIGVNKCAKDYPDVDVIKKCEYFIDSNRSKTDPENPLFYRPVTNRFENISYWNEFCAICNYETEFEYWSAWTYYNDVKDSICIFDKFEVLKGSAADDLHHVTLSIFRNGLKVISDSVSNNVTELHCTINEYWPLNLIQHLVPCVVEEFQRSHQERLNSCAYLRKDGKYCENMIAMIEGIDFVLDKNKKIILFDHWVTHKEYIPGEPTINSKLVDVIYFCKGGTITLYGIADWMIIALNIFSIIFLCTYLFLKFSKRYLQSFPNKIIFSYAIGLLISHLITSFVHLIVPLLNEGHFFSYIFQFFWTMIMSLEFCRLTYSILRKRKVDVGSQPKRYLIYCIVGYVIPTVLIMIYLLILRSGRGQCPLISGHFGAPLRPVLNSSALRFYWGLLYIFYAIFVTVIPILFILQCAVLIYVAKCGPAANIRSTANRHYSIILIKMGYIMGAPWVVNLLSNSSYFTEDSLLIRTIAAWASAICVYFQGVLIFLLFGFKKSWISDFLNKFKCEKKSSPSINDVTGATVQSISTTM